MAFDMNRINSGISTTLETLGADIAQKSTGSGENLSEIELLKLQGSMQKWSIMVNMHSNIQKTWSDGLKAVVSNLR